MPSDASKSSSAPLPVADPSPAPMILEAKPFPPISFCKAPAILKCGVKNANVPKIGYTTPLKSAKSPVDKPKLLSSTIMFCGIFVPSGKVLNLIFL